MKFNCKEDIIHDDALLLYGLKAIYNKNKDRIQN